MPDVACDPINVEVSVGPATGRELREMPGEPTPCAHLFIVPTWDGRRWLDRYSLMHQPTGMVIAQGSTERLRAIARDLLPFTWSFRGAPPPGLQAAVARVVRRWGADMYRFDPRETR